MNGRKIKMLACLAAAALVLLGAGNALAVSGACVNCHTMHNSQHDATYNGSMMVDGSSAPSGALTRGSGCYGCHGDAAGVVNGSWSADFITPQVSSNNYFEPGNATGTTLAGGSFYWVVTAGGATDSKGHNVYGIAGVDGKLSTTPPGWNKDFNLNTQVAEGVAADWGSNQLTCAGTYGCHGKHADGADPLDDFAGLRGAHHANKTAVADITGGDVGSSYRFLYGIKGNEDSDWEFQPSASAHNQYYGDDRDDDTTPANMDKATISYLCAECHGNFHSGPGNLGADDTDTVNGGTWASTWVRHPTDYDMNDTDTGSEYKNYNKTKAYNVEAPVASTVVSSVQTAVLAVTGDAIVTCVSCHRAHGSPYADLLRWDYGTMIAGDTSADNKGCFVCHTAKDGVNP